MIQSFSISKRMHSRVSAVWRHRNSHTGEFTTDETS